MLPIDLIIGSIGSEVLVVLKNGETIIGHLQKVDSWMNLQLTSCVWTSQSGMTFKEFEHCNIRGIMIQNIQVEEERFDKLKEETELIREKARQEKALAAANDE
mmetsp:Transcript_12879/g.19392  ORF Transcript_12879/g.19392 Transcript_12879/m.19392 type:complete len:103 (+) Transcript_12879:15-323(+)